MCGPPESKDLPQAGRTRLLTLLENTLPHWMSLCLMPVPGLRLKNLPVRPPKLAHRIFCHIYELHVWTDVHTLWPAPLSESLSPKHRFCGSMNEQSYHKLLVQQLQRTNHEIPPLRSSATKNCKNKARESCRIQEELHVGGHGDEKLSISEQQEEKRPSQIP